MCRRKDIPESGTCVPRYTVVKQHVPFQELEVTRYYGNVRCVFNRGERRWENTFGREARIRASEVVI